MKLLDIKELCSELGIKPSTLYSWVGQGRMPHVRINGLIRFLPEEIESWVKSSRKEALKFPLKKSRNTAFNKINALIERAKREVYNPTSRGNQAHLKPQKGGR